MDREYIWEFVNPIEVKTILKNFDISWWVCGGWAIELYIGNRVREHKDIDVTILRKDHLRLKGLLPGWDLKIAKNEKLHDWSGETVLSNNEYSIWTKLEGSDKWAIEFLLNQSDDNNWIFRNNKGIKLELDKISYYTIDNIPFLRPEIPLMFKSSNCSWLTKFL